MKLLSSSYRTSVWLSYLFIFSCSTGSFNQSVSLTQPPVISEIKRHEGTVKLDSSQAMVPLAAFVQPLLTEFPYAGRDNFTKQILYKNPQPFLRLPVAIALSKAQNELKNKGLSIKIWDAYRPYSVTKKMWAIVPDERYAANPAKGSGHNRGAAIDLTLVDIKTGKELRMPTGYDNFTENAHHSFQNLDKEQINNRKLLRETMETHGFVALETEWWHYSWPNAAKLFPLLDIGFDVLAKTTKYH